LASNFTDQVEHAVFAEVQTDDMTSEYCFADNAADASA